MKIGYARVSTWEQDLDSQVAALVAAGCGKIYQEKESGKKADRPELVRLLSEMIKGDVVVVTKLDRLGRSLLDLLHIVSDMKERGVGFTSVTDSIDTTSTNGTFVFHMLGAVAQFERSLISDRTKSKLKYLKEQGVKLGRPVLDRSKEGKELARLVSEGKTVAEICALKGWNRGQYFRIRKGSGEGVRRKTTAKGRKVKKGGNMLEKNRENLLNGRFI